MSKADSFVDAAKAAVQRIERICKKAERQQNLVAEIESLISDADDAEKEAQEAYAAVEQAKQADAGDAALERAAREAHKKAKEKRATADETAEESGLPTEIVGVKVYLSLTLMSLEEQASRDLEKANEALQRAEGVKLRGEEGGVSQIREAVSRARERVKELRKLKEEAGEDSDVEVAVNMVLPQVAAFFSKHDDDIFDRLEDCDDIAGHAVWNKDVIFIGEGLPIINGIILVSAKREQLNRALRWVREYWHDTADPLIMLSTLVFKYVVNKGVQKFKDDPNINKQVIWERIEKRIETRF
jgi:enamine deaminase RidA (YjgF/YER057c/UK114 family)